MRIPIFFPISIILFIIAIFALGSFIGWSVAKFQDISVMKEQDEYHRTQTDILQKETEDARALCAKNIQEIHERKNNCGKG